MPGSVSGLEDAACPSQGPLCLGLLHHFFPAAHFFLASAAFLFQDMKFENRISLGVKLSVEPALIYASTKQGE